MHFEDTEFHNNNIISLSQLIECPYWKFFEFKNEEYRDGIGDKIYRDGV